MQISSAKDLNAYKNAYGLAMEIYRLSKNWPPEEKYSLTDQIRRSSDRRHAGQDDAEHHAVPAEGLRNAVQTVHPLPSAL